MDYPSSVQSSTSPEITSNTVDSSPRAVRFKRTVRLLRESSCQGEPKSESWRATISKFIDSAGKDVQAFVEAASSSQKKLCQVSRDIQALFKNAVKELRSNTKAKREVTSGATKSRKSFEQLSNLRDQVAEIRKTKKDRKEFMEELAKVKESERMARLQRRLNAGGDDPLTIKHKRE